MLWLVCELPPKRHPAQRLNSNADQKYAHCPSGGSTAPLQQRYRRRAGVRGSQRTAVVASAPRALRNTVNTPSLNTLAREIKPIHFLIYTAIFFRRSIITQSKVSGYCCGEARPVEPSVRYPVITRGHITFVINLHCVPAFMHSELHRNLKTPKGHDRHVVNHGSCGGHKSAAEARERGTPVCMLKRPRSCQ